MSASKSTKRAHRSWENAPLDESVKSLIKKVRGLPPESLRARCEPVARTVHMGVTFYKHIFEDNLYINEYRRYHHKNGWGEFAMRKCQSGMGNVAIIDILCAPPREGSRPTHFWLFSSYEASVSTIDMLSLIRSWSRRHDCRLSVEHVHLVVPSEERNLLMAKEKKEIRLQNITRRALVNSLLYLIHKVKMAKGHDFCGPLMLRSIRKYAMETQGLQSPAFNQLRSMYSTLKDVTINQNTHKLTGIRLARVGYLFYLTLPELVAGLSALTDVFWNAFNVTEKVRIPRTDYNLPLMIQNTMGLRQLWAVMIEFIDVRTLLNMCSTCKAFAWLIVINPGCLERRLNGFAEFVRRR